MEMLQLAAQNALFEGIDEADLARILRCTGAVKCRYRKDETILRDNRAMHKIGILISGKVLIARDDVYGNHYLLARASGSELFGLSFSTARFLSEDVYVYAETDCEVILMDARKLLDGCEVQCECHSRLMKNALTMIADKNLALVRKQAHMARHSMRGKIASYLIELAEQSDARQVTVPFRRQAFADYLGVDRSALCAEISRMKRDGLLDYHKQSFTLYDKIFS